MFHVTDYSSLLLCRLFDTTLTCLAISGIVSLEGAKYTLDQARRRLLQLIDKDTIIIGQSLENDFKVLRLIHTRVIDTAMVRELDVCIQLVGSCAEMSLT